MKNLLKQRRNDEGQPSINKAPPKVIAIFSLKINVDDYTITPEINETRGKTSNSLRKMDHDDGRVFNETLEKFGMNLRTKLIPTTKKIVFDLPNKN